jgi:hypothetical protein
MSFIMYLIKIIVNISSNIYQIINYRFNFKLFKSKLSHKLIFSTQLILYIFFLTYELL